MSHPYQVQPDKAYWKRAVSDRHFTQISELFSGVPGIKTLKIATAGSCFAQHIGRNLKARGLGYMDYEPAPAFLKPTQADRLGYGVYSCRYGNIYTTRQLFQLFQEAFESRTPQEPVWRREGRFFDALRPGVEPDGFGSEDEARALRTSHLERVRALLQDLDLFVFTFGLTEAWVSVGDGTTYPVAPGVIAGDFDASRYKFQNYRYGDIYTDMRAFIESLRRVNRKAKVLLTVSPVPLTATATNQHVLVATTYSKSVLRAVAGDLASDIKGVFYFPSYEIITGQPSRHVFYNPDLRTVAEAGVDEVMRHFFGPSSVSGQLIRPPCPPPTEEMGYEHCEEALLDTRVT